MEKQKTIDPFQTLRRKQPVIRGYQSLNNRPLDLMHNHEKGQGATQYRGFSETAPAYHLFVCTGHSPPPRKEVRLLTFDRGYFDPESKAGLGGCSMRGCPGDAVAMSTTARRAYCERCALRARGIIPCPSAFILPCYQRQGLDLWPNATPCPTCAAFEEVT
jgi:hypothetical protein